MSEDEAANVLGKTDLTQKIRKINNFFLDCV